jgi:hypothetical protein
MGFAYYANYADVVTSQAFYKLGLAGAYERLRSAVDCLEERVERDDIYRAFGYSGNRDGFLREVVAFHFDPSEDKEAIEQCRITYGAFEALQREFREATGLELGTNWKPRHDVNDSGDVKGFFFTVHGAYQITPEAKALRERVGRRNFGRRLFVTAG